MQQWTKYHVPWIYWILRGKKNLYRINFNLTRLQDQWIKDGDGFMLVYSVTEISSFHQLEIFRRKIARVKESSKVPFVIIGNKSDKSERQVSYEDGILLLNQGYRWPISFLWMDQTFLWKHRPKQAITLKSIIKLSSAFFTLVREIRSRKKKKPKGLNCLIIQNNQPQAYLSGFEGRFFFKRNDVQYSYNINPAL